uniref:G_PROTEIN_RECEP_F1_2 domain-containing protein n=2 Tax=Bursaphelenchus xylophilus TaxID=6326 RepID=A0A1I7RW28_BURXY
MEWHVREVYVVYVVVICTVSTCLSLLVLGLSIKLCQRKLQALRSYAKIVAFNTCMDIWFIITTVINFPVAIEYRGLLFLVNENPLLRALDNFTTNVLMLLYTNTIILLALCHMVHFWYRYQVFCKTSTWSQTRYLLTFLGFTLWVAVEYTYACVVTENVAPYYPFLRQIELYNGNVPPFIVFSYAPVSVVKMAHYQIIITTFYSMVLYFGYKTWRQLHVRHLHIAAQVQNAQRTILKTMIMQALYPVIIFLLPIVTALLSIFVDIDFVTAGYILTAAIYFIPILNSLSVLALIPSYRRMVTCAFLCNRNTHIKVAASTCLV